MFCEDPYIFRERIINTIARVVYTINNCCIERRREAHIIPYARYTRFNKICYTRNNTEFIRNSNVTFKIYRFVEKPAAARLFRTSRALSYLIMWIINNSEILKSNSQ